MVRLQCAKQAHGRRRRRGSDHFGQAQGCMQRAKGNYAAGLNCCNVCFAAAPSPPPLLSPRSSILALSIPLFVNHQISKELPPTHPPHWHPTRLLPHTYLQVRLSEEDLAMMVDEASKASHVHSGVDKKTYFSVMKSCTLF